MNWLYVNDLDVKYSRRPYLLTMYFGVKGVMLLKYCLALSAVTQNRP